MQWSLEALVKLKITLTMLHTLRFVSRNYTCLLFCWFHYIWIFWLTKWSERNTTNGRDLAKRHARSSSVDWKTLNGVIVGCAILMQQSFCQKFNSTTDGGTRGSLSGGTFSAKLLPDWTDTVMQLLRNNTYVGPEAKSGVCRVWITPA